MTCLLCGLPLTPEESVWRVVHEECEDTMKETDHIEDPDLDRALDALRGK